jgi:hydrocephalus-inducing protein
MTSPPALRQTLRFEVPLGSIQTESFIFRTYNAAKTEYTCATKAGDKSMFAVAKTFAVEAASGWDGDDARLPVTFEPTEIGSVRDTLTVTSPVGGEYVCDLVASCVPPLPQGPFPFAKGGGAVDIPFRNCFPIQCNWSFAVDSPAFKVNASSATVGPKSEGKCAVVFDPQGDALTAPGGVVNAKLFVTCTSKPELPPWVYYLRGTVGTGGAAAAAVPAADAAKKK